MSQHEQTIPSPASHGMTSVSLFGTLLQHMIGKLECGELLIETPGGSRLFFEGRQPGPQGRIKIHSWRLLSRFMSGSDISVAESYMAGEWSTPDLAVFLTLGCRNTCLEAPRKILPKPRFALKLRHALNRNTRSGSRRNIAAHYDLGNEFYQPWLDTGMNYSAGIYSNRATTLEAAQDAKIDRICALLDLNGGEKVLEIGCGWGAVAERLVRKHDTMVTGITLSTEQLAYARQRLRAESKAGRCDLRLQDYRDVTGAFDRVVSIEMLEAVGEAYWPTYFRKLRECLRPGGTAVIQAITISEDRFESYRRRPDFIQKYIFPGGMLPTAAILQREMENAGLRLASRQFFGDGYALTLADWRQRFENAWPQLAGLGFDLRFKRMWEYYLAYCQAGFATGAVDVGLFKIVKPA